MGMHSSFVMQDLKVLDKEELKKFVNDENNFNLIDSDGEIDFCEWDNHKLEGYWYKETVEFLKKICQYIEGIVEFQYEEGYNFRIVFENKKVYTQTQPKIEWKNSPKKEL